MNKVRAMPCEACPYRRDVPSGIWARHEYAKLKQYDQITPLQPFGKFACHASPEAICHGWAVVHSRRGHEYELVALRIRKVGEAPPTIPQEVVPLFSSGCEAAEHGMRDLENPSEEAREFSARLMAKHPRLDFEAQ